jgi:hypothetical protein
MTTDSTNFNVHRQEQNWWNGISQTLQTNRSVEPARPRTTAARSYFRSLHAAEMAAWEVTGGDYALPGFLPHHSRARN